MRPLLSDVYSAVDSLIAAGGDEDDEGESGVGGPFDAILANPPFVAVPPPPPGASTHAEWALYADGGPDGARVLNAVGHGLYLAVVRKLLSAFACDYPSAADALSLSALDSSSYREKLKVVMEEEVL